MLKIGLIKEGKIPSDTRVALTPPQCKAILEKYPDVELYIAPSADRCYADDQYAQLGIRLQEDLSHCDVLLGIKEVPIEELIPNKTYFFFSHTKKKQPYNQKLMQALIAKKIRMIDYETLTYEDGTRLIGFGFFAGVVGAHNGLMTYGRKTRQFNLIPAHVCYDMDEMLYQYRNVHLPPVKIAVTGSGKVTAGVLDIMHHWDIESVEPEDFLEKEYDYPVYTLLKGHYLYQRRDKTIYHRNDFHEHPEAYECVFPQYLSATDILINGIYWDKNIPRLFEPEQIKSPTCKLKAIADITCDPYGSVPINVGASTIADPVYGIDRNTLEKAAPYQNIAQTIDVMAVDNLPNELPRDASKHFGEHIMKYIIPALLDVERSELLARATICEKGKLTPEFDYLADYAYP